MAFNVTPYSTERPARSFTGCSAGYCTVNVLCAPGSRPINCSENPGGLASAPRSIVTFSCFSASAGGSLPATRRSRSTVAQSPAASGRPSTGSNRAARSRSRSSVSSTAVSSTAAEGFRSAMPR